MIFGAAPGASVWQLKLTGWPWWFVLPLAVVAVWCLLRLHRREMAPLNPSLRRRLLLLRGAALGLLVLFFLEPNLSRKTSEKVLPLVGILVDQSGSMAVKDTAGGQSRHERALVLARQKVLPAVAPKARVKVFGFNTHLTPLDLNRPSGLLPNRATDFEAAFSELSRSWAQEYVGGVVLLSDGRQTAGGDALPMVGSLRARGAIVSGILVGDPAVPPDAVVAEISGSAEVFLGETVPLTVRYRITGADDLDWDMLITRSGQELARRTVRGNGRWQYQSFAFPATNAGVSLYQARLELPREQRSEQAPPSPGPVTLELWTAIAGSGVADLVNNAAFTRPPASTTPLIQLAYGNRGEQYGARLRGFLIPPQSGNYTFWISSDDSSELWLSSSANAMEKSKIAFVAGFVPRGTWDGQPSQKSQPVPLQTDRPCYFEILHKQSGGEDHLSVGWQLPDGTEERPIPSTRLCAYDPQLPERLAQRRREASDRKTSAFKEASLANNAAEFAVAVNQDALKVLLVDSSPRWESRYLAALFERDRRVSFTRRYHSVILEDPNLHLLPKNQTEWDGYDLVCLGDLDSAELPVDQQKLLANFVARRGGCLVCLAGPRGLPSAFSLGALANLLPVRVSRQSSRESEPVKLALTAEGAEHPIMHVLNDPELNQKLWPLLPPLEWVAGSVVAKPGATVLLAAENSARTPVVAVQRFGAGRVFWMGTEESWRWRDRVGERVHETFWLQVMRWGLAGRLRGKDPRLQVGLDRYLINPSETADLKARVATRGGETPPEAPLVKAVTLDERGAPILDSARTTEMLPVAEAPGIWHLALGGLGEGFWRIEVSHGSPELEGLVETREVLVRGGSGAEGWELAADPAALNRISGAGGHYAAPIEQAGPLLKDFASKLKPRPQEHHETLRLWNNYLSMVTVVVLLCIEWVLRKRHGLP